MNTEWIRIQNWAELMFAEPSRLQIWHLEVDCVVNNVVYDNITNAECLWDIVCQGCSVINFCSEALDCSIFLKTFIR